MKFHTYQNLISDKLDYKNDTHSGHDDRERPRDLREKLNRNRSETFDRNFVKSVKSSNSNDRWSHDLYDEKQQAPKSRSEMIDKYGCDVREQDRKVEKNRKLRPERRNLNDAIKISLGMTQRPRREIQEIRSRKDDEEILVKKVETRREIIKESSKKIDENYKKNYESHEKNHRNYAKTEETFRNRKELMEKTANNLKIPQDSSKKIDDSFQKSTKIFIKTTTKPSQSHESAAKDDSTVETNENSLLKMVQNHFKTNGIFSKIDPNIKKSEESFKQNYGCTKKAEDVVKRDLNSRLKRFTNEPEEISPKNMKENIEIKPEIRMEILLRHGQSQKGLISAEATEFVPSSRKNSFEEQYEDISFESLKIYDEQDEEIPVQENSTFGPSKLQNRLNKIRGISKFQQRYENPPNSPTNFQIQTNFEFPEHFSPNFHQNLSSNYDDFLGNFIESEEFKTEQQSSQEFLHITASTKLPTLPSNFTQIELDALATESLAKLTENQQTHLIYIVNVPQKYFQEAFEYFVEYFKEVQCVPLNMEAVNSYLLSRRVEVEEIKPPKSFQHEKFSFVRKEDDPNQTKRERNPIKIVDPNEEEKIMMRIYEDLEIDNEIDNMFTRRS